MRNLSVHIQIKSELVNYDLEFGRRISVVTGDSGIGKSTILDIISEPGDAEIKSTLPIQYADRTNWRTIMKGSDSSIIMFDDLTVVASREFANLIKSSVEHDNYYILITREGMGINSLAKLSISVDSLYTLAFNKESNMHTLQRLIPYHVVNITETNCDCCLVEDKQSGFKFIKDNCKLDVFDSTSGKSTIIADAINLVSTGKCVVVFMDLAGFGCHMYEYYQKIIRRRLPVFYVKDYECFEELILQTNMFKADIAVLQEFEDLDRYANKFISWEVYFEDLLHRVTKGKPYKCSHTRPSVISDCYFKDCSDCNSYVRQKCDKVLEGKKIIALLEGTKYERLLGIMKTD